MVLITSQSQVAFAGVVGGDSDPDGDEWFSDDNCPFVYNPGQEDKNGDGVGDVCIVVVVLEGKKIDALKDKIQDFVEGKRDADKLTKKLDKVLLALNPIDHTPKHIAKLLKDTANLLDKEKITTVEYDELVTAIQTGNAENINAVLAGIILSDKDLKKLTKTIDKLNPDLSPDFDKACKELDGFNKEVNKLFEKGKLTETEKDVLIVDTEAIKTSLECV